MKAKLDLKKILAKLKKKQLTPQQTVKEKRTISKKSIFTMIALGVLVIAHIAILLAILWSFRYYSIYPSLFGSIVAIVLCAVIIIDIIFFIGFNHKDMALKVISATMALLLMIGGTFGAYYIGKANLIVNNVLDDGKTDKYETYSGVFVCYDKFNRFTSLKDLAGKRVGLLLETSDGITYLANKALEEEKVDFATVDYKTNAELMQALLDGDVDAIAITSAYRTIYGNRDANPEEDGEEIQEEVITETETETQSETEGESSETVDNTGTTEDYPFAKYLDHLVDFHSFEEDLKVNTTRSTKNLSKDPFNVLLIGYSRTDIGSPIGLADSIILTTINPQTYTVAMTSIARDSFVPISCYSGEYDKINSGRSTSRACFIETVEKFLDMEIDYYMELDYLGLVQIVNAIGGIEINNPVEFTLDGIYVPAGEHVFADGQMALQFCRERHHMPGGDFDRQQHQKEVIMAIAKKFIESGDITLALNAMEQASDWMSTDFTLSQLTSVFNLLLNTKNYTGMKTFDLVDFQNTRITGYGGILYYNYSMRLPLWVYLIYEGSYNEAISHVNNVLGRYDTINQTKSMEFNLGYEYERSEIISTEYEKKFIYEPEPMPAYWIDLEGYSLSAATAWANANGVKLNINYINLGDEGFNPKLENMVVSQSARYGSLVSDYPVGTITVMGKAEFDESKQVPNFIEHSYTKAVSWAKKYGVPYSIDFETDVDGKVGDVVEQSPRPFTDIDDVSELRIVVKAGVYEIKLNNNGHGKQLDSIKVKTGDKAKDFPLLSDVEEKGTKYIFEGWFTEKKGGQRVYDTSDVSGNTTIYAHWEDAGHKHSWGDWETTKEATCEKGGVQVRECSTCGKEETRNTDALGHKWGDWKDGDKATCTEGGSQSRKCSRCGETQTRGTDPLGHNWKEVGRVDSDCDNEGEITYECSRCGEKNYETIPVKTDGCGGGGDGGDDGGGEEGSDEG